MVQNLAWAVGTTPLPFRSLRAVAPFGIVCRCGWALLMSLSTIIVAVNAQTLRGLKL